MRDDPERVWDGTIFGVIVKAEEFGQLVVMKKSTVRENFSSPPPRAAPCLTRNRSSSQKGGTLINESVTDLETHNRWMLDPDRYRPSECKKCHHDTVHMHNRRSRVLLGDPAGAVILIAIYLCIGCHATWRILPRFLARHLWRRWNVVEAQTVLELPRSWPKVPGRTRRRWLLRLRSSADVLVQLFASSASQGLESVASSSGLKSTRATFAKTYSAAVSGDLAAFADLAAHIHRLLPGFRLM